MNWRNNEWKDERMNKWMNEWNAGRINERLNEGTSELEDK